MNVYLLENGRPCLHARDVENDSATRGLRSGQTSPEVAWSSTILCRLLLGFLGLFGQNAASGFESLQRAVESRTEKATSPEGA